MRRLQALALALMLFVAVIVAAGCSAESEDLSSGTNSSSNATQGSTPDSSGLPEVGDTELVSLALPAMV